MCIASVHPNPHRQDFTCGHQGILVARNEVITQSKQPIIETKSESTMEEALFLGWYDT
jgi:hypothetical protein